MTSMAAKHCSNYWSWPIINVISSTCASPAMKKLYEFDLGRNKSDLMLERLARFRLVRFIHNDMLKYDRVQHRSVPEEWRKQSLLHQTGIQIQSAKGRVETQSWNPMRGEFVPQPSKVRWWRSENQRGSLKSEKTGRRNRGSVYRWRAAVRGRTGGLQTPRAHCAGKGTATVADHTPWASGRHQSLPTVLWGRAGLE